MTSQQPVNNGVTPLLHQLKVRLRTMAENLGIICRFLASKNTHLSCERNRSCRADARRYDQLPGTQGERRGKART